MAKKSAGKRAPAKRAAVRDALAALDAAATGAAANADRLSAVATGHGGARREVLRVLSAGPLSVPAVARRLRQSRQSVQRLVDLLEADGHLQRMRNPDHRVSALFTPTPAGLRLLSRFDDSQDPWVRFVAKRMTEVEVERLSSGLARLDELAAEFADTTRRGTD